MSDRSKMLLFVILAIIATVAIKFGFDKNLTKKTEDDFVNAKIEYRPTPSTAKSVSESEIDQKLKVINDSSVDIDNSFNDTPINDF